MINNEHILIIDDSVAIVSSLSQLIELVVSGSTVVADVDFAAGLTRIETGSYSTIILDVSCTVKFARNREGITPIQLLEKIVSMQPAAKIIFMSGRPISDANLLFGGNLTYPFLLKPFSLETLLSTMNSAKCMAEANPGFPGFGAGQGTHKEGA